MLPLSPALFIAAATALIGDFHCDPPSWCGPVTADGLERDAEGHFDARTTAAFIAHVGYWSHHRGRGKSSWPFPLDADCETLALLAARRAVLSEDEPRPGAIYLRRSDDGQRFTRASIVLWAQDVDVTGRGLGPYDCGLIEGGAILLAHSADTANRQSFETRVLWTRRAQIRNRPGLGDRFISWVDLDRRNDPAVPQRRAA